MGCIINSGPNQRKRLSIKDQLKLKIHHSKKQAAEIRQRTQENQLNSKHSQMESKSPGKVQLGSNLDLQLVEQEGSVFKYYSLIDTRFKGCQCPVVKYSIVTHNLTQSIRYVRVIPWDCITQPNIVNYMQKKKFEHMNLQTGYEIYSDCKNYYQVEDYCSGNTLATYLKDNGAISEAKCALIIHQLFSLFEYLHCHNLIHNQLTLDSFMFLDESSDLIVRLVDVEPLFEKTAARKTADETFYYSPEYCKTKKKSKSNDIWAIGMIAYQLLTNYHPYRQSTSQTVQMIEKNIVRGGLKLDCVEFEKVSDSFKILIRKLLTYEARQRIDISQCTQQKWIKKYFQNEKAERGFQQIKQNSQLQKINAIQACILLFMVNQFNSSQKQFFASIFNNFDTNQDSKISFAELQNAYQQLYPKQNCDEVVELFKKTDIDNNGYLEFHEFVIASVDKQSLLTSKHLQETFKLLDKNNSGKVNIEEIQKVCKLDYDCIKKCLDSITTDENYNITFSEFKQMMYSLL